MCVAVLFGVGAIATQAYETGELSDEQKEDIERVSLYLENETQRGIVYAWLLDSDNFAYHNESESKSIFASITTTLDYETAKDSLVKILAPTYTAIYEKQLTIEGVRLLSGVLKQFASFVRISSPTAADAIQNNAEDIAKDVIQMGVTQSKLLDGILDYTDGEDKNLIVEMLSEFVDSDMYYTLVEELSYVAKEFEFVIESLDMWFEIQVIQSADEEFISLLEELYESDALSSVMKKAIRSFINDHDTLHVTMRTVGKATVKLAVEEGLEAGFDAFLKFLGKKCPALLFWKYCIKAGLAVSDFLFNTSEITQFMRGVYMMNEYSEALLDIIESKVNLYSTAKGVLKAYYAHQIIYDLKILKNMRVVGEENMLQLKESTYSSKFVVAFGQWTSGYWKDIDTINKWYSVQQENFGLVDTWLFGRIKTSEETKPAEIVSGTCGSNLTWELNLDTGVLTIDGKGAMNKYNYNNSSNYHNYGTSAPWDKYWSNIETVIIEEGVTTIGDWAFRGCGHIETIQISESVTYIGEYAFQYCTSLTSINLPKNLKRLNPNTFSYCGSLTSITLPSGLASIGEGTFYYCESLTSIVIPSGISLLANKTFFGCRSLNKVSLPDGLLKLGECAFAWCISLAEINIPKSVMSIERGAFQGCCSLTECELPHGITTISYDMFSDCTSLSNVIIPQTVTCIGRESFENCSSLCRIDLHEGITTIDFSAFYHCSSLVYVSLPQTLTNINQDAFKDCASLTIAKFNGTKEVWRNQVTMQGGNSSLSKALTFLPTHTHSHTTQVATEAYLAAPATCTTPATYYYSCSCGEKGTETFTYGATAPHTEETVPAEPATCTKEGHTAGKHCSVCGTVLQNQETIPAMGHTPGDWITDVEPTVGTEGHCQQSCTACGRVLNEETIPALPEETEPETEPVTEPESEPTPETEPVTEPATAPETTAETDPVNEPETPEETTEASDGQVTVTIPVDGCSGSILSCGLLMLIALAGAALIKRKE